MTDQWGRFLFQEMYRFALRHHRKPADPTLSNKDGLTPVALSAKLGRQSVFNEIISLNTAVSQGGFFNRSSL